MFADLVELRGCSCSLFVSTTFPFQPRVRISEVDGTRFTGISASDKRPIYRNQKIYNSLEKLVEVNKEYSTQTASKRVDHEASLTSLISGVDIDCGRILSPPQSDRYPLIHCKCDKSR